MPTFLIEQREPGDPRHGTIEWTVVATIDEANAAKAIHEYCIAMQYYRHELHHNTALVYGVGWFRAVPPAGSEVALPFVIQQQDPIGPHDLHLTWSDVATVASSDAESALQAYLDAKGWATDSTVFGHVANIVGIGSFRAVRAEHADDLRVTPKPA